ncbi:MAG: hypothetical protein QM765_17950 [Myxococcales bacterium]
MAEKRQTRGADESCAPPMPSAGAGPLVALEVLEYVARAGIQAPSGDNAQPWGFRFGQNKIDLYLDRAADLSFFNVDQLASIVACGAAAENMRIAATALGLEPTVAWQPEEVQPDLMARLTLRRGAVGADPLFEGLWGRCTNRRPFSTEPLPDEAIDALQAAAASAGASLLVVRDRPSLDRLSRVVYRADRIRTEHRGLHEHLVRMIRFDRDQALLRRDGFPLENLEAGFVGGLFLRATRSWSAMRVANALGMGRAVAVHSAQGMRAAGAAALLTVPEATPRGFLEGGQALERVWLELTVRGLQMQPMTALTLFGLRWQREGAAAFSQAHQALLRGVWAEMDALFEGFANAAPVMLFRFGRGPACRCRTLRKAPSELERVHG